jgi:flagellar biosynthesis GTPase FlhF
MVGDRVQLLVGEEWNCVRVNSIDRNETPQKAGLEGIFLTWPDSERLREAPTVTYDKAAHDHTLIVALGGLSSGDMEAASAELGIARISIVSAAAKRLVAAGQLAGSGASAEVGAAKVRESNERKIKDAEKKEAAVRAAAAKEAKRKAKEEEVAKRKAGAAANAQRMQQEQAAREESLRKKKEDAEAKKKADEEMKRKAEEKKNQTVSNVSSQPRNGSKRERGPTGSERAAPIEAEDEEAGGFGPAKKVRGERACLNRGN